MIYDDETPDLGTLPPPKVGELDIGDLRFGSDLESYLLEDHLNQPTAFSQSNAGSVGLVDVLRTDMSAVVADNRVLPEVIVTLTVNATQRDDVNKVLRPLVAMQRRLPFTVARSHDLARMMLGMGLATDNSAVLKKHLPQEEGESTLEYDQRIHRIGTEFNRREPSTLWIPITIRSIDITNQPGAPDLYQVHVVLRYANVDPYVTNLKFWKRSEDAVQWARYLGVRSHQGIEVLSLSPQSQKAIVMMPTGKEVEVQPPVLTDTQTSNPHQSYVFKKFYRGLLQEHQAGRHHLIAPPIGYGVSNSTSQLGVPIHEPAYPISDPTRLFEQYVPNTDIGLAFVNPQSNNTRAARLAKIVGGFEERSRAITLMQNAATALGTTEQLDELDSLGKISPWTLALTRNFGVIWSTAQGLGTIAGRVIEQIETAVVQNQIAGDESIRSYVLDPNSPQGTRIEEKRVAFADELYAAGLLRQYDAIEADGSVNFFVNSKMGREEYIELPALLSKWQEATLADYAQLVADLETANTQPWQDFITTERTEFDTDYKKRINENATTTELTDEFTKYMLSFRFFKRLADAPGVLTPVQLAALRERIQVNTRLIESITSAVEADRAKILDKYTGNLNSMLNYIPLDLTAIERVSLRFSSRYGDKEWDAYAHPVTQHVGGANAEVTFDLTTNDQYVLDQLGAIRVAQLALADLRKSRDVVPPLIDVYGPGNLLRAFGIKRLAYRAHSATMADDRPGYYQIRLDLIQDEDTLIRSEKLYQADAQGNTIFHSAIAAPLLTPGYGDTPAPGKYALTHPASPRSIVDFETTATTSPSELAEPILGDGFGARDKNVQRILAAYVPRSERVAGDPAFAVEVIYADKNIPERVEIDALFPGLVNFMEFAEDELTPDEFRYLQGQVEIALSSEGYSGGVLLALFNMAFIVLGLRDQAEVDRLIAAPGGFVSPRPLNTDSPSVLNNMTLLVSGFLNGDGTSTASAYTGLPLRYAADALTRVLVRNDGIRRGYLKWLELNPTPATVALAGPATPAHPRPAVVVLDYSNLPSKISQLLVLWEKIAKDTPTCYPDLLMPEVRDPVTQTNLMGYDFPFGPGTDTLENDTYLTDYRIAEGMHEINQLQMAMVGMDLMTEYAKTHQSGPNKDKPTEGAQRLQTAYNIAMADIHQGVKDLGNEIPWPFSLSEDSPNYFDSNASGVYDKVKPFQELSSARNQLTRQDWVNIMRFSETLKYTTRLLVEGEMAFSKMSENPDLSKDATEAIKGLLAKLDTEGLLVSSTDLGSVAQTYSTISTVQDESGLAYDRKNLIALFASDPKTIAAERGYTDPTGVALRQDLRNEIIQSWSEWLGMRRAFPSYMMLIVSQVGGGFFRVMADQYAWTAVQSIEIREQAEAAGQYCDLILSNMRWRLGSDFDKKRALILNNERDQTLTIKPGTYMNVYTGYGPDIGHLYPFAGRVVEFLPGPVAKVSLASYSTTLNNPPSGAQGFYVDGWDGQQTIQEAIIYTLSQTSGLEGLGRQSYKGGLDALNRTPRGDLEDDYRTSLMIKAYRKLQKPGLAAVFQDRSAGKAISNMVDLAARFGLTQVKELALGDPALYENIWVVTGRPRYGFANLMFGGLPNWLQNGKGWGWAAFPDETCWAQLNDQALMFPDYVVTTRPYNVGVPLANAAVNPLRQTVYFGPQHGRYIYTDDSAKAGRPFAHLVRSSVEDMKKEMFEWQGVPYANPLDAEELYKELFYDNLFVPTLIDSILQIGGPGLAQWFRNLREKGYLFTSTTRLVSGLVGSNAAISAGMRSNLLTGVQLTDRHREYIRTTIEASFPGLGMAVDAYYAYFDGLARGDKKVWADTFADAIAFSFADPAWYQTSIYNALYDIVDPEHAKLMEGLMTAFKESMIRTAHDPTNLTNLGLDDASQHASIKKLQSLLADKGFRPDQRTRRLSRHYPANMYTQVCNNDVMASGGAQGMDQDFANRILLTFPVEADKRMQAFAEKGGTKLYELQANPGIDPDGLVEKAIYYPNLRSNLIDDAGLLATQIAAAQNENGGDLLSMLQTYSSLVEQLSGDDAAQVNWDFAKHKIDEAAPIVHISEAVSDIENQLQEQLRDGLRVRPKYQVVGHNLLKQGLQYMYQGTLSMAGDPRMHCYDVIHLWDDVKEMHGPVTVGGVFHSFSSQGFYTVIQPRLYTALRGVDPTVDLLWMDFAFRMYNLTSAFSRIGRFAVDFGFLAGRIGMYGWALGRLGPYGAAAATALTIGDALWTAGSYLMTGLNNDLSRFVGILTGALDANPVIIVPLTYKQKAYTAGLDGVHGPAAITTTLVDAINRRLEDGDALPWFDAMSQYLNQDAPKAKATD